MVDIQPKEWKLVSPGNRDLYLQKKDNKRKGQVFNKGYHCSEGKKNDHQSWLQP